MANIVFKPNQHNYSITNLEQEAKTEDLSLIKEIQRKLHDFFEIESPYLGGETVDELYEILIMVDALARQGVAI